MRIDSNLEKLLKNYQEKLSEYKKIYGEYTFAKEHPEILMSEEDKTRYPDEKSQKMYHHESNNGRGRDFLRQ